MLESNKYPDAALGKTAALASLAVGLMLNAVHNKPIDIGIIGFFNYGTVVLSEIIIANYFICLDFKNERRDQNSVHIRFVQEIDKNILYENE